MTPALYTLGILLYGGLWLVGAQLKRLADAHATLARALESLTTHGVHLRNYPGAPFHVKDDGR